MKYEIKGTPLPVAVCYLEPGEQMITEKGSMSWMSPNMEMDTNTGGGVRKVFGRLFSGESIFLNDCTQTIMLVFMLLIFLITIYTLLGSMQS